MRSVWMSLREKQALTNPFIDIISQLRHKNAQKRGDTRTRRAVLSVLVIYAEVVFCLDEDNIL